MLFLFYLRSSSISDNRPATPFHDSKNMGQRFAATILVYDGFSLWTLILEVINNTAAVLTDIVDCTFTIGGFVVELDVRHDKSFFSVCDNGV
jgi:hypothetical protein